MFNLKKEFVVTNPCFAFGAGNEVLKAEQFLETIIKGISQLRAYFKLASGDSYVLNFETTSSRMKHIYICLRVFRNLLSHVQALLFHETNAWIFLFHNVGQ